MSRIHWMALAAIAAVGPIEAQETPTPQPADAARTARLAQEVSILRAVNSLNLTQAQLQTISRAVADAHRNAETQRRQQEARLARQQQALAEARAAAVAGDTTGLAAAEEQWNQATAAVTAEQNRTRAAAIVTLRDVLRRTLTAEQVARAEEMVGRGGRRGGARAGERGDRARGQGDDAMANGNAAPDAANGESAGGQSEGQQGFRGRGGRGERGVMRMTDRIRNMSPEQYNRLRQRMVRRGGGTQEGAQWIQQMDALRQMSPEQYRAQRGQIAQSTLQWQQQQRQAREMQRAAQQGTAVPSDALGRFVERYLIPEPAPEALAARLAAMRR